MKQPLARSAKLRKFGSVTRTGPVAKYLNRGREAVSRQKRERVQHRWEEGLYTIGFLLGVRIGNDARTFHTAHLASVMFFQRDLVGDQTTMCTGAGRAHWEGLWG